MLIKEVCTITKLTKKAVKYYEEQGLVCPKVSEKGYRDSSKISPMGAGFSNTRKEAADIMKKKLLTKCK